MTRTTVGKRVKHSVDRRVQPLEERQRKVEIELAELRRQVATVDGDGPWADRDAADAGEKDAGVLVHFTSDSTWDDDAPLEPVDPARYPRPQNAAMSAVQSVVPARETTMFTMLKWAITLTAITLIAAGALAVGGLAAWNRGLLGDEQVAEVLAWLNAQAETIFATISATNSSLTIGRVAIPAIFRRCGAWLGQSVLPRLAPILAPVFLPMFQQMLVGGAANAVDTGDAEKSREK